ncbi:hypothetical protein [Streptomyces sp. NPDC003720]|uniref:hypothetical protein n=1 Tax=Streptomyces sp. NPDC003720 TaxID=3364684 RepID=UPI0036856400
MDRDRAGPRLALTAGLPAAVRGPGPALWLRGGRPLDFLPREALRHLGHGGCRTLARDAGVLTGTLTRLRRRPVPGPRFDFTRNGPDSGFALLDKPRTPPAPPGRRPRCHR